MPGTILFVDDETELAFMVASYFELSGYAIVTAANAPEAMRQAEGKSLGVIILDVNLPHESSSELMDYFKKNHPNAPVLLYTGREADDDAVKQLLARGARRHLLKNGSLEGLLAAVKEICG